MRVQPSPCCSSACGPSVERWRIVLLLIGAALLLGGGLYSRLGSSASPHVVVGDSIVVRAESPRAVVSKPLGAYTLRLSDMRDELSLLLVDSNAAAVPLSRFTVQARYAPRGGTETPAPVAAMNDHLMTRVDPAQAGTLTVSVTADGQRHTVPFEMPLVTTRRTR